MKKLINCIIKLMSIQLFITYFMLYLSALKDINLKIEYGHSMPESGNGWYYLAPIVIAAVAFLLFKCADPLATLIVGEKDENSMPKLEKFDMGTLAQIGVFILGLKTVIEALAGTFNSSLFTIVTPMLFTNHDYKSIALSFALPLFKLFLGAILMLKAKAIGDKFAH